jgi:peptidoglycan hydrolase-like protein with peptidoglycan-binding domain
MERILRIGVTGSDVRLLQQILNHHLTPTFSRLATDGIFGPLTRAAVIEFQRRNQLYPAKMPLPAGTPPEFRRPLAIDGEVGPLTANVLFDVRPVYTLPGANFSPIDPAAVATSSGQRRNAAFFGTPTLRAQPVRDPVPGPSPSAPPVSPPAQTFRLVQLSIGQQATANPWSLSPFVFTGQYTLLAKNDGRPDFLLTAGGQASLNDGGANGRWTGQGFLQMGLGGYPKLFGNRLDFFNPFVAVMLAKNFSPNQPATLGGAIGNQVTWTLLSKPLPGTDDKQDTLSLFFNAQAVANVDLTTGRCAAPSAQFLIGAIKTFF